MSKGTARKKYLRYLTIVSSVTAFLLALAVPQANAYDAKQIFDAISNSTVLIEDVDGSGSGVFISDKGLILTNHHVVAANIALKVKAKVRFGNKIVVTESDQVKVTKIHPKYDIALLEVQPPANGSFIPAPLILKTEVDPVLRPEMIEIKLWRKSV